MNKINKINKIDINKHNWRSSREFFQSLEDKLRNLDDKDEKYDFTWVGKRKAIIEAGSPINKTLRPDVKGSKNWDTTQNIFIEGDNLDALKLLQESYLGKVKIIYIDPPYNTGKDFVYHDNFKASSEEYDEATEYKDEEGNIQYKKNEKSSGRYHSDWLSMMYPRLKLARNFLKESGVILISIDDNEQANLKKLCDGIFGDNNFIGCLVWEKKKKGAYLSGSITNIKEYVLCYVRNINNFGGLIGEINSESGTYPIIKTTNSRGTRIIRSGILSKFAKKNHTVNAGTRISVGNQEMILLSDLIIQDGKLIKDVKVDSNWIYSQKLLDQYANSNELYVTQDLYFRRIVNEPREKMLKDILPRVGTKGISGDSFYSSDDLFEDGWGTNEDGNAELHELLGKQNLVEFPKPSKLISKLIASVKDKEMICLDFFAGSGTTAHAVMQLNAEDGGNRKWIMVQLPEVTPEGSEARKAGYTTIPEIARERIRRAGDKVAKEHPDSKIDCGFRSLIIADTSFKDVYKPVNEISQASLLDTVDNIKEDRTALDLLYSVLVQLAWELNRSISIAEIDGVKIYIYDYQSSDKTIRTIIDKSGKSIMVANQGMVACFEENITEYVVKQIAQMEPKIVIFRESSFADSQAKVNLAEHFRVISPDTKVRVI